MVGEAVVLLHGLGRGKMSMSLPTMRLRAAGFRAVNLGYPSTSRPIEELAAHVQAEIVDHVAGADTPVHFLTHSMGGIVLRTILAMESPGFTPGHVVMLCPPNRGSLIASKLKNNPLFRVATGPAGQQIGRDDESLPNRLGPPSQVVGVIAGNRPFNPLAILLPGESDGTVAVDETPLDGMADFLLVPCGHTFIMNDPDVIDQAIHFFRSGRFRHGSEC